jgi:SOS response regulatory protein OraA/RecX
VERAAGSPRAAWTAADARRAAAARISRDLVEAFLDAPPERRPEDDVLPETDEQRAAVALERHLRGRPLPDDPKGLQRLGMFLMRRGFRPETVRATIRAAGAASDDDS